MPQRSSLPSRSVARSPKKEGDPGRLRPSKARIVRIGALLLAGVLLAALAAVARLDRPDGAPGASLSEMSLVEVSLAEVPRQARETLALIKQGGPFPYRQDGAAFGNREQRLPRQPRGYYTEYTVRTPSERDRGPRRIVAGKGITGNPATSGEYYYTEDHYNTFRRIRE
jgi:ribonuclease T1